MCYIIKVWIQCIQTSPSFSEGNGWGYEKDARYGLSFEFDKIKFMYL